MLRFAPAISKVETGEFSPSDLKNEERSGPLPAIEIRVFSPEIAEGPTPAPIRPQRKFALEWERLFPRRGRFGSIACGAVIAALHILVFVPLLPGSSHQHRVSNAMGSTSAIDEEPALQVRIIQDPPLARVPPPPTTAVTIQTPELPSLDPPADLLKSLADKPTPTPDALGNSALAGRYLGQIDARIERVWLRPRTPVDSGEFQCKVRVEQDSVGTVLEVQLEQCNGDARWQQSLVRAIQVASPLPAPPDPRIFRRSLRLSFTGKVWSTQEPSQGYEPLMANDPSLP